MRPDPGLQTWQDAIHVISFVRGEIAAATHCGLLLPVRAEDLSGRETCAACFSHWLETDDAREWTPASEPASPTTPPATPAASHA